MKIQITVGEAQDRGKFEELCDIKGIDPWAVNEGKGLSQDKKISLELEEARELGLIKREQNGLERDEYGNVPGYRPRLLTRDEDDRGGKNE